MLKARRQAKILELIRSEVIQTQEELAARLNREGIPVTQATVSRDIKELQLQKVPAGDGRYRYAMPEEMPAGAGNKWRRILQESVLTVEASENLVVIKALPATGPSVGAAVDYQGWSEVIGTVAGDDTLLVVVKPKEAAEAVVERIRGLMR